MKSPEELLREYAGDPARLAQYACQLQDQLAEARAYIAELKQQLFGPKADHLTAEQEEQLQQLTGEALEQAQRPPPLSQEVLEPEVPPKDKEKSPRRRRRPCPPVELEVRRRVLEPEDKTCAHCDHDRPVIGQETTTEYNYEPAKLVVQETVRPKYGTCSCGCAKPGVTLAPLPPRLVPQSKLGLGLAVHLLLSRFDDHVAYYTLERIFRERHGVIIPRQQMVPWVEKIAFLLLAIYSLIWEERLRHFKGTIQTDAYEVSNSLRRERPRTLRRLGCLSHARRRFHKALLESSTEALWFIGQIRQLYAIEDEVRDASPASRRAVRRQKAPALWRALKRRAEQLRAQPRFLPQSTLGKAVNYFLKEYTPLVGYLRDGRFEIDNNLVENDVRPPAVGRRRWLFIGHPDAGWRSAVIYTIIQTCRRHGLNPQEYLTDALSRLPAMKNHEVKQLLPSRWKPTSS